MWKILTLRAGNDRRFIFAGIKSKNPEDIFPHFGDAIS
jgi:hypothetical protein